MVGDVLYERAATRLQHKTRSIREISEELGYADQAHFTRFFQSRLIQPLIKNPLF